MIKSALKKILPRPVLASLNRTVRFAIPDMVDAVTGRRDPVIPPRRKIFIGNGDVKKVGDEFMGIFRNIGGLRPGDAVLDIGCGIGRMSRPLTAYLAGGGSYEGFDIDKDGVEWCKANVTPRFPHFRFQVADIYNKYYNPKGRHKGEEYRFPFEDNTFDFAFLTSVFTHMLPGEVGNYLGEIARVLKPGGRCLMSYFIWNGEAATLEGAGKSAITFPHAHGIYRLKDKDFPEHAVAYDEVNLKEMIARTGLAIQAPIRYGSWCGRKEFTSFQDLILAVKT